MNVMVIVLVSLMYAPIQIESKTSLPIPEETVVIKTYCSVDRVLRMLGYDCSNMNLKEIPQNAKSSVEVFDLSFNRIRDLTKNSFARYSDIKLLYLFDNLIQEIEEGTFAHLTSLEAIDLSINALKTISLDLFKLPRLRNLYYSYNNLQDINDDLKLLDGPIIAPLQKIQIASCRLSTIPAFGILPELTHLNISFNPLDQITPQQFSPFCSLTGVAIENSTELSPCMCKTLRYYFDRQFITIKDTFDCPVIHVYNLKSEDVYCAEVTNATVDSPEFETCLTRVQQKKDNEESKRRWMWIVGFLAAFFIAFISILYSFHRRNVKRTELCEKQSTKLRHIHQTTKGNVEQIL